MFKTVSLIFVSAASAAQFFTATEPVQGSYVVVFKKGIDAKARMSHMEYATSKIGKIDRKYSIGEEFNGYAAHMDQNQLSSLLTSEEVDWIEEDGVVHASDIPRGIPMDKDDKQCTQQTGATWGLVRSSEFNLKITGDYNYPENAMGAGVTAYIIDTGVYIQHQEFDSRASWGGNFVDRDDTDGNGHGTHCAGTVGGRTYGLAKRANIVGIKVLSASGSGTMAGVIDGVNFVANNAKKPATANMSLGGGMSAALNSAVNAAVTSGGVVMVVAAGNDNRDACNYSPASATQAITVAATSNTDSRASFSNFGTCTNVFAPGVSITSAWINSPTAINTISGTSMACPHVCGQVAKYLSTYPTATPAMAAAFITSEASTGKVTNPGAGSPNKLLFADCTSFPVSNKWDMNNTEVLKIAARY